MWWYDYWPMPWVFGPLIMIVFMALCMGMMMVMMRRMHGGHGSRAVDILKERYARGEITQAEYKEQRRMLEA